METIKDEVKVDLNVTQSIFVFVSGEPISEVHIRTTGVRPEMEDHKSQEAGHWQLLVL
jgi:hypothetical protein